MKKLISLFTAFGIILSSAAVLPETAVSEYLVSSITAQAKEKSVTDYTYEITPLLSPFNEYFFVKTDNPDPYSFSFADKSSKYSDNSLIKINEDTSFIFARICLYSDVVYENEETGRVNGGYIFHSEDTDGGEIVLQKRNYDYSEEDTYEDTNVKLKLPALIDSFDYLIKTYANKSSFFDNMDAVQSGLNDICLYSNSYIKGEVYRANEYWFLSTTPHVDQTFYIQSPYRRYDNKYLLASDLYPYIWASLSFPAAMGRIATTLDPSATWEWNKDYHWKIDVTYKGETRSYGGAGKGEGSGITEDQIIKKFSFANGAEKLDLASLKVLLDKYSAMEETDDYPHYDDLTWDQILDQVGESGAWIRLYALYTVFGSYGTGYTFLYKNPDYSDDPGYVSDCWVDGRYINRWEFWEQGVKFEDAPTANILINNAKIPVIESDGGLAYDEKADTFFFMGDIKVTDIIKKNSLFQYDSETDMWITDFADYFTIKTAVDSGKLDKKYLDMITLTKDEVLALNVDRNTNIIPPDGYIYDGTTTPGTAYHITPLSDSRISVTLSSSSYSYTGGAIKPTPTVKLSNKTLKSGTDYTVTYKNNISVGTASVIITGKGDYTGTISRTFKINAASVAKATVSRLSSKSYTGKAITQTPTVKLGSKTLKKGTDYTISFKNNKAVGTATVTIKGKGNYTGNIKKTFKITKASVAKAKVTGVSKKYKYTGKAIKPAVKVTLGGVTLKKGTDYTVSYKSNKKVGTATITITGKGSYKGTVKKTFKIVAA